MFEIVIVLFVSVAAPLFWWHWKGKSSREQEQVFYGARTHFKINGDFVSYAKNVSAGKTVKLIRFEDIDKLDFVPVNYRVTLSAKYIQ